MSAAYIAKVQERINGVELGPCPAGKCQHRDCAGVHRDAAKICRLCDKPIGYGAWVYGDNDGDIGDLVHRDCAELEADRRDLASDERAR
jgi:hypothetical protein